MPSQSNLESCGNFDSSGSKVDVSCRKMTRDDERQRGLANFRDSGHSLSIAVTDKVLHRPKTRMPRLFRRGIAGLGRGQSTWHPAVVLLDPPCSYDRRVPAFLMLNPAIIRTVPCLRRCMLPPVRGQPLNSDLRRARIRLAPVGVRDSYSRFRANFRQHLTHPRQLCIELLEGNARQHEQCASTRIFMSSR